MEIAMRRDEIRRLTEQRKSVHTALLKLNEDAEKENRNLTAEEAEQFDKMSTEFEELKDREERATRLYVQEREVDKTIGTPLEKRIGDDGDGPASLSEYKEARGGTWHPDEPEVRAAYFKYLLEGDINLDVEEKRALSRATGAAGNFLVPTDMADQIVRAERFMGGVEALTNIITTESGETVNVPTNLTHGVATATAENAAYTASDETFGQVALGANKVATKIIVSEELVQDSGFPLDSFLAQEFGERIGIVKENQYINGSGTGQAQGLITTGNGITVVTAATGNTTTLSYTALVTAIFSLPAQYRRNAVFVVADGAARNLYLMLDSQNRPLWSVNVASSGPDTFLGYPIYTHPDLPAPAASSKSMIFGDLRRTYWSRIVRGYSLQRQNELHSDNGQIGFRAQQRFDGKVVLADAARIIQHSAT